MSKDPSPVPVTREGQCQRCGRDYPTWYTDDYMWNAIAGKRYHFLCLDCFALLANERLLQFPSPWYLAAGLSRGETPVPRRLWEQVERDAALVEHWLLTGGCGELSDRRIHSAMVGLVSHSRFLLCKATHSPAPDTAEHNLLNGLLAILSRQAGKGGAGGPTGEGAIEVLERIVKERESCSAPPITKFHCPVAMKLSPELVGFGRCFATLALLGLAVVLAVHSIVLGLRILGL